MLAKYTTERRLEFRFSKPAGREGLLLAETV
jgi:hypothetical protein